MSERIDAEPTEEELAHAGHSLRAARDLVFKAQDEIRTGRFTGTLDEYLARFAPGGPGHHVLADEINRRVKGGEN